MEGTDVEARKQDAVGLCPFNLCNGTFTIYLKQAIFMAQENFTWAIVLPLAWAISFRTWHSITLSPPHGVPLAPKGE